MKAYKNEVVKNIDVNGEMHRYIPVLAKNAGFIKIDEKVVQHQARKYGTTKFGMDRFINGFLDLITISFLTKYGKTANASFWFTWYAYVCTWFLRFSYLLVFQN